MPQTARLFIASTGLVLVLASGCDSTPDTPAPPIRDKALECLPEGNDAGDVMDGGSALACASGEICLQGRCYTTCADDSECGPGEECAASGACVLSSGPRPDAGPPVDSGPPDPCDAAGCVAPQVCHPLSGTCVDCNADSAFAAAGEPGFCPLATPICDIANGRCVPFAPRQCAPCKSGDDSSCDPGDGSFVGRCVTRDAFSVTESVCMASCAGPGTCPDGLECDGTLLVCKPTAGENVTCTTWLAATQRRACLGDPECSALGAGRDVFVGACVGFTPPMPLDGSVDDAGMGSPGSCSQPCGTTADCFDQASGQICDTAAFVCVGP